MELTYNKTTKPIYLIILTTSIGAFITPFFSSAISFSVPSIARAFNMSFNQVSLVPMIFLLSLASFILLFGKLADVIGRSLVFQLGLLLFSVPLIVIPFTKGYYLLLLELLISGSGAGMVGSNSTSIISSIIRKQKRGLALGINAMSVYLGLTLAPPIAGYLDSFFNWGTVFIVSGIIGIICLSLSIYTFNGLRIKTEGEIINIGELLIFSVTIFLILSTLTFVFIMEEIYSYILASIGILFLVIFILIEKRSKRPLFGGELFKGNREFVASNLTAFLNYTSTFSVVFVFSIYLQSILHIKPSISGLILLPEPIFMVLFSPISGYLSDKFGSTYIASLGMALISISFLMFYLIPSFSIFNVVIILSILGMGFGFFSAPNTNSVMGSAKGDKFGTASGFLGTMRFSGQLISVSLATFILSLNLPRNLVYGIFIGVNSKLNANETLTFVHGLRILMLISSIISAVGAYISYKRD